MPVLPAGIRGRPIRILGRHPEALSDMAADRIPTAGAGRPRGPWLGTQRADGGIRSRDWGGLRLAGRRRGKTVASASPATGWRLDLDGRLRLRLRPSRPAPQSAPAQPRSDGIEARGARGSDLGGPFLGPSNPSVHSSRFLGRVVLAVGDAVARRLAEPFGRGRVIGIPIDALSVQHREIVHGLAVTGFRGARWKRRAAWRFFLTPRPFSWRPPTRNCAATSPCLATGSNHSAASPEILRQTAAFGMALCALDLGGRVALRGRGPRARRCRL